jgi:hypothetical protein
VAQVVKQGGSVPAAARRAAPTAVACGGDGRARRTNFTHGQEDAERLQRLCERFGKDRSGMIRFALELAEGSARIYRHAVRQRTVTIEALAQEVRLTWDGQPTAAQISAELVKAARGLTALFEEAPIK